MVFQWKQRENFRCNGSCLVKNARAKMSILKTEIILRAKIKIPKKNQNKDFVYLAFRGKLWFGKLHVSEKFRCVHTTKVLVRKSGSFWRLFDVSQVLQLGLFRHEFWTWKQIKRVKNDWGFVKWQLSKPGTIYRDKLEP